MSDSTGKVSVLMPSFNYARYLSKSIESVLSQSYENLELIITDDCSTDGSRDIANDWKRADKRVITVFHDVNRGLSAARNSGLAKSSGQFVALCDADDIWSKDKLQLQMQQFRERPEVGVVHSDGLIIDSEGELTGDRYSMRFHQKNQVCSGMLFTKFCLRNFVCNSTVILKRECVDYAGGFDERLRSLEDWVCWTRVSRKYPFQYIAEPLISYRIHRASLSVQVSAMARHRATATNLLLAEFRDIPRGLRSVMQYQLGVSYMELGESKAAFASFRESIKSDPTNLRGWVRCGQVMVESLRAGGRFNTGRAEG